MKTLFVHIRISPNVLNFKNTYNSIIQNKFRKEWIAVRKNRTLHIYMTHKSENMLLLLQAGETEIFFTHYYYSKEHDNPYRVIVIDFWNIYRIYGNEQMLIILTRYMSLWGCLTSVIVLDYYLYIDIEVFRKYILKIDTRA